ncbi:type II toxin-antitoxin system antitoxin SocA domain-containing protein [Chloroflexota bacterium]
MMGNMSKGEAVLLGVLCHLGKDVLRTKFVKLIYLLDNLYFENMGTTLTGFNYHWDRYGPNTVGNALVDKLSELTKRGLVIDKPKLTPYENYANYYRCNSDVDMSMIPLSNTDWTFISAAVKKYGHLSREAIVAESKKTAPMQDVNQYDVLQFKPNPATEALKQRFFSDKELIRDTKNALTASGDIVELDELREEVAEQQAVLR